MGRCICYGDEKIKTDTFIAEFFDSDISFVDTSELVAEVVVVEAVVLVVSEVVVLSVVVVAA